MAEEAAPAPLDPRRRRLQAIVLVLLLETLPAVGLVQGIQQGEKRLVVACAAMLVLFAPAPVFFGLGRPWAPLLGLYTAGMGILVMFLNAVRLGSLDWLFLLVPYGAATYLFQQEHRKRSPAAAPPATETSQEALGHWLKENVEAIVVAFIMALVIRCFCIEVFKIPSGSMEPTLLGDATAKHMDPSALGSCRFPKYHNLEWPGGDRIMVTKYYYIFEDVARFDVVVFKFPLELPRNFIKRVTGLPEEEFMIWQGNLYARPLRDPDPRLRIQRKPIRTQASLWIDLDDARRTALDRQVFEQNWIRRGEGNYEMSSNVLRTAGAELRFRHAHDIEDDKGQKVGDLLVAFDVVPQPGATVLATVENEMGRFELVMESGGSRIEHTFRERKTTHPLPDAKLRAGRVQFMVFDGQAVLVFDDRAYPAYEAIHHHDDTIPKPRGVVEFGARGTVEISKLRVGRDVYYKAQDTDENFRDGVPLKTGPGEYIMMGDNVGNSHDSRKWKKYTFHHRKHGPIVFEGQARKGTDERAELARQLGLAKPPDYYIKADINGREWHFDETDLDPEHSTEPEKFIFVHRRYIIGKAFWVWWPPGRWFKMIR